MTKQVSNFQIACIKSESLIIDEEKDMYVTHKIESDIEIMEKKIMQFLYEEGVEMKNPIEKMYDYFDNVRNSRNDNISQSSFSSLSSEKSLNISKWQKRKAERLNTQELGGKSPIN